MARECNFIGNASFPAHRICGIAFNLQAKLTHKGEASVLGRHLWFGLRQGTRITSDWYLKQKRK